MTVQFLHCRDFMVVCREDERPVAVPFEGMHLVEHLLVRVFARRHGVLLLHACLTDMGVGVCVPFSFRPGLISGARSPQ